MIVCCISLYLFVHPVCDGALDPDVVGGCARGLCRLSGTARVTHKSEDSSLRSCRTVSCMQSRTLDSAVTAGTGGRGGGVSCGGFLSPMGALLYGADDSAPWTGCSTVGAGRFGGCGAAALFTPNLSLAFFFSVCNLEQFLDHTS